MQNPHLCTICFYGWTCPKSTCRQRHSTVTYIDTLTVCTRNRILPSLGLLNMYWGKEYNDTGDCGSQRVSLSVGRCGSGGRAVVWQSEGCRFDPTLGVSKCPWARHLTPNCSWRAGWYLAWQPIAVGVWMCVWKGEWEAKIVKRFG